MFVKNIFWILLWINLTAAQLDLGFWWKNKNLARQVTDESESRSLKDRKVKIRTLPPSYRPERGPPPSNSEENLNGLNFGDDEDEERRQEFKWDDEPDCSCVPNYLCSDGSINTDGHGIFDERSGLCKTGEVCCRIPKTSTARTTSTTTTTTKKSILSTFLKPAVQMNNQKCGKRGGRIEKRILFDVSEDSDYSNEEEETDMGESVFGEFPWMIEIRKKNRQTNAFEYLCGGVLINPTTILTVSHSVRSIKKPSNLVIRAGEWDRNSEFEYLPHQDRTVSRIINHPQYYSGGLYNDIAIIKFNEPLDMIQSNIQSICLPDENDVFNGQVCTVTGWGKNNFEDGQHSQILKYVDLPIVENQRCEKNFQDFKFGQRFKLHESFICAGGLAGKDSCEGDGGSPLVCKKDGSYVLAGLVSWGVGCGHEVPGAYTNIPKLVKWIKLNA